MAIPSMARTLARQWLPRFALLALPCALYWPALWMRYGFRDDYSTLREAVEEPGKLFWFTATAGRPVYGLFLEPSFRLLEGIDDLVWCRIVSALWIGVVAAVLAWLLEKRQGWGALEAWLTGALITMLPSAQVLIGWAICWPQNMATALSLVAFALNDWGLSHWGSKRRISACAGGTSVLIAAILIYQPSGLFYVVPMAGGVIAPIMVRSYGARWEWLARHIALVVVALLVAYAMTKAIFLFGIAAAGPRVVLELDWIGKIAWFLRAPLDNALGLFVVENQLHSGEVWHQVVAVLVSVVSVVGGVLEWRRRGVAAAWLWFIGGAALTLLSYSVSMVAKERWPTYRTMYALSGVVAIYLVRSITLLGEGERSWRRYVPACVLGLLCAAGSLHAHRSMYAYHAVPQNTELWRLGEAVWKLDPDKHSRVYLILPNPKHSYSELRYLDEFGSLSADSEWCTKEMMMLLLRERFPDQPECLSCFKFFFGNKEPASRGYDVVIDLRLTQ